MLWFKTSVFHVQLSVLNDKCVLNTALKGQFAFWIRKKDGQGKYRDNHIYSDKVYFSLLISRNTVLTLKRKQTAESALLMFTQE